MAAVTVRIQAVDRVSPGIVRLGRALDRLRYRMWAANMEHARTAFGAREVTRHVPEGEWLDAWRAGMDPASAVAEHLQRLE